MRNSFRELKKKSQSGEALALLLTLGRYNLGTHKKTRLQRAGIAKPHSLLHANVSKKHACKLEGELKRRATRIRQDARARLRFLTILHSVEMVDLTKVAAAVEKMDAAYRKALGRFGLWSRGSVELEIVNLTLLQKAAEVGEAEARKLNVLSGLLAASARKKIAPH